MSELLSPVVKFTYTLSRSITDSENVITLFDPPTKYCEQIAFFRAFINKYLMRAMLEMQSRSSKEDNKEQAGEIDEAAVEMMVASAFYEMGEKYSQYLKLFKDFLCLKDVCFIGDFQHEDPKETSRQMKSGYISTFFTFDELEDIAIKYSARFFMSKKFLQF